MRRPTDKVWVNVGYNEARPIQSFNKLLALRKLCDAASRPKYRKTQRLWVREAMRISATAWIKRLQRIKNKDIRAKTASIIWWDLWSAKETGWAGAELNEMARQLDVWLDLNPQKLERALYYAGYFRRIAVSRAYLEDKMHVIEPKIRPPVITKSKLEG